MKTAFRLMLLSAVLAVGAYGDLLIVFDSPFQQGSPGETLLFTGIISNIGSDAIFLNSVSLNFEGTGAQVDFIDQFFSNVPFFLDPGEMTIPIEFFRVLLGPPGSDPPGLYTGSYSLLGGADFDAQELRGSAGFGVNIGPTAVPEPGFIPELFTLLPVAGVAVLWLRRRRQT